MSNNKKKVVAHFIDLEGDIRDVIEYLEELELSFPNSEIVKEVSTGCDTIEFFDLLTKEVDNSKVTIETGESCKMRLGKPFASKEDLQEYTLDVRISDQFPSERDL